MPLGRHRRLEEDSFSATQQPPPSATALAGAKEGRSENSANANNDDVGSGYKYAALRQVVDFGRPVPSSEPSSPHTPTNISKHEPLRNSGRSRKKRYQNSEGGENDESDQHGPNIQELAPDKVQFGIRLSCPIYLQKPLDNKGCAGHNLTNTNYVKQHMKRCHVLGEGAFLGPYCSRCRHIWPNDTNGAKACDEHCRSWIRCAETTIEETGRLLLEEFQNIKLPKGDETQRWQHLFRCLYKHAPLPASPHHEDPVARMTGLVFAGLPQLMAEWGRPPPSAEEIASLRNFLRKVAADCGSKTMVGQAPAAQGSGAAVATKSAQVSQDVSAAVAVSTAAPLSPQSPQLNDDLIMPDAAIAEAQPSPSGSWEVPWLLIPPSLFLPNLNEFLDLTDGEWVAIGRWLVASRSAQMTRGCYSASSA